MQKALYIGPRADLQGKTALIRPHKLWSETMVFAQFEDHTLEEHEQWWPFMREHFNIEESISDEKSSVRDSVS